jgi:hypothetical protein
MNLFIFVIIYLFLTKINKKNKCDKLVVDEDKDKEEKYIDCNNNIVNSINFDNNNDKDSDIDSDIDKNSDIDAIKMHKYLNEL